MNLDDNVTAVKGIGDKTAESFQKLGIEKIRDLISYFPRDYKSYSEPVPIRETSPGDRVAVFCRIVKNIAVIKGRRYRITTTVVSMEMTPWKWSGLINPICAIPCIRAKSWSSMVVWRREAQRRLCRCRRHMVSYSIKKC